MESTKPLRVLWLLNYTSLRNFEFDQLRKLGITEVFAPKFFPYYEDKLSLSVDENSDTMLSIPKQLLDVLNAQNWYENPSKEAWEITNQYFDIAIIGPFPEQIMQTVNNFHGAIVMRALGLANYTQFLYDAIGPDGIEKIKNIKSRFWFATSYENTLENEGEFFKQRSSFLPLGLQNVKINTQWSGENKRILLVCPRINTSPYYKNIYNKFIDNFSEFQYTIVGIQPIKVDDSNVIGCVEDEIYHFNLRTHRLMFYHSTETSTIDYSLFDAIHIGLPIIFMAGGILDKMGAKNFWGRCSTLKKARIKIKKLLNDKGSLAKFIKNEQKLLLENISPAFCETYYKKTFEDIIAQSQLSKNEQQLTKSNKKYKIAIIVPVEYRGGSLRRAIALANSIVTGATYYQKNTEVVLAHLDRPEYNSLDNFNGLSPEVTLRSYKWDIIDKEQAIRAMTYAGHPDWVAEYSHYCVPQDGMNQFLDCSLWVVISDRLANPLLPIKPHVLMVYDYIQRYIPFLDPDSELMLMKRAHAAKQIWVTTQFTGKDATQYAGLHPSKVIKLPMLVPNFDRKEYKVSKKKEYPSYFIWTTNKAVHKNHLNVFLGLKKYYEELDGSLECHITGCHSDAILEAYSDLKDIIKSSFKMQQLVKFFGELSDYNYQEKLQSAEFLLHAALIDNGTFSVIEAAQLGIPSISSNYPPMREINERFNLNLMWMEASSSDDIADKLKKMEQDRFSLKQQLLEQDIQQFKHSLSEELYYWKVVSECL